MNILEDLVKSEYEYTEARQMLLNAPVNRVKLIKENLNIENSNQCRTYLQLMEYLTVEERKDLVNDISDSIHTSDSWGQELWNLLVKSENKYFRVRKKFLNDKSIDRSDLIQRALHHPEQRGACLRLIKDLNFEEQKYLFDDLLELSSIAHSDIELCHQTVFLLPYDWLLENIEKRAERLLINGTYEEYRCLLELYNKIDNNLTQRLVVKAIEQDDLDIIEAGTDFQRTPSPIN